MAINPEEYYQRKKASSHHHHHHRSWFKNFRQRYKLTWERDKKMILGVILIGSASIYVLFGPMRNELKDDWNTLVSIIKDEPDTEINVDALHINREERMAKKQVADSIAYAQQVDSLRQQVQTNEVVPVYRPPKNDDSWYLKGSEIRGTYEHWRSGSK